MHYFIAPTIGLLVTLYIVTRMVEILSTGKSKVLITVMASLTMLAGVLCIAMLVYDGAFSGWKDQIFLEFSEP